VFQSRAGFSPCRDRIYFNPGGGDLFQSRAGFSPCRDVAYREFQSRAGFSPCRDRLSRGISTLPASFNPVLGFLPAATSDRLDELDAGKFQSRAGFSPCRDELSSVPLRIVACFNPVLGFLPAATGGQNTASERIIVSHAVK